MAVTPQVTIAISQTGADETAAAVEKVRGGVAAAGEAAKAAAPEMQKAAEATEAVGAASERAAEKVQKAAEAQVAAADRAKRAVESQRAAIERLSAAESRRTAAASRLAANARGRSDVRQTVDDTKALVDESRKATKALGDVSAASTAAAEAADKAAAGLTRKVSPGMAAAGRAASKAWSAMRILANILPNFGIGGFILAAVAGFKLLQKAMNSSASAAETYSRILKRAQAATEDYAKALADSPYRAAEETVAQVQLAQALKRTTDERAKYLALVGSAKDDVAFAEADERGAVAALKHAASISEMAAANDRVRAAQKRRAEAQTALEFAQIKLGGAEEQHLTALKASKDAERERSLSVYNLRDAFVSATDSLIGGPGSFYSALMTIEREGKRVIGSVVEAATPKKRTAGRRRDSGGGITPTGRQTTQDFARMFGAPLGASDAPLTGLVSEADTLTQDDLKQMLADLQAEALGIVPAFAEVESSIGRAYWQTVQFVDTLDVAAMQAKLVVEEMDRIARGAEAAGAVAGVVADGFGAIIEVRQRDIDLRREAVQDDLKAGKITEQVAERRLAALEAEERGARKLEAVRMFAQGLVATADVPKYYAKASAAAAIGNVPSAVAYGAAAVGSGVAAAAYFAGAAQLGGASGAPPAAAGGAGGGGTATAEDFGRDPRREAAETTINVNLVADDSPVSREAAQRVVLRLEDLALAAGRRSVFGG